MFDDLFRQPIPTAEAATFYTRIKRGFEKTAEWTDPPDMEGLLEGKFLVPVEQVLQQLKVVATAKFRKMVAYYTYAQSINDIAWRALKIEFYEHAEDEQEGAEFYVKRATVLGGPVHLDPIEPPPASTNPIGILKIMIRAEQEGIAAQRELRQMVGDENPMKIGIEEVMAQDQHHLDELWQMLPRGEMQAMEAGGAPMEEPPAEEGLPAEEPPVEEAAAEEAPAEEEPSEQEVTASMRLAATLEKTALGKPWEERSTREKLIGTPAEVSGALAGGGLGYLGGKAAETALERAAFRGSMRGHPAGSALWALSGAAKPVAAGLGALGGTFAGQAVEDKLKGRIKKPKKDEGEEKTSAIIAEMRLEAYLHKLAQDPGMAGGDEAGDGISPPTAGGELQPQNYLAAELMGQQAQAANEAGYYRQQLGQAQQSQAMMEQQMADTQMQLDQLQQQAAESGQQIEMAAQEAMAARDDAVNATLEVAKARIGAQKMRQSMLELASQDPQALGEEAMAPAPPVGPDGMPMEPGAAEAGMEPPPPEEGPAGSAPAPAAAPGAEPPAGEPDMTGAVGPPPGAEGEGAEATTQLKTGSAAIGAGLGGVAGAASSLLAGRQAPALRERVQQLEGSQDGSFGQAAALAAAKGASAGADLAAAHPVRSAISGGLTGAMGGAAMGPSLVSGVRELAGRHIPAAARRVMGG